MTFGFDAIILAIPLFYFGMAAIRDRDGRWAHALVGFYAYPLLATTAMSAGGAALPGAVITEGIAATIRVALHPAITVAMVLVVLLRRTLAASPAVWPALLTVTWMALSVIVTQPEAGISAGLRVSATLLVACNGLLLVPSIAAGDREQFVRAAARGCIWLACFFIAVSIYAVARYGFYPVWTVRLNRPLNASVLAYLIGLGIASTYSASSNRTPAMRWVLLLSLLLPASRINLTAGILAVGGGGVYLAGSRGQALRRAVAVVAVFLVGAIGYTAYLDQAQLEINPFQRSAVLSGRGSVWTQSLAKIAEEPVFGAGDRVVFEGERGAGDEGRRAHNMALEAAMSYGIPAAAFALSVYLVLFYRVLRPMATSQRWSYLALGMFVGLNAMFATGAWTNLGDGTAILVFLLLAPISAGENIRVARSSRPRARSAQPDSRRSSQWIGSA